MTADEVREKFIKFFEKHGHKRISPSPLVPQDDPSTLFTSSGMQPLVPYLMGESHPEGKRLVNSQPCIRVQDIEEVGDNRHTTFFEMLGNWSLGSYFKEEQLSWFFEFLTDKKEGLGLNPEKIYVSVFDGSEDFEVINKDGKSEKFSPDLKSIDIWKRAFEKVGIKAERGGRIREYPADKNWWSRSGTPEQMPVGEIGGPDSEVFYDFGEDFGFHEEFSKLTDKVGPCHPNCDCGRFLEIGNCVFIQYKKTDENTFEELPNKNVDFGGGLERMAAVTNNEPDVFKIDVFQKIVGEIRKKYFSGIYDPITLTPYYPTEVKLFTNHESQKRRRKEVKKSVRIIADHLRASVFLGQSGVVPSNKQRGYVMRRLIRKSAFKFHKLGLTTGLDSSIEKVVSAVFESYQTSILESSLESNITKLITEEIVKFMKTIDRGIVELNKTKSELKEIINEISPGSPFYKMGKPASKIAFNLYQSYGLPIDIFWEEFKKLFMITYAHGEKDRICKEFKALIEIEFEYKLKQHAEKSRTASSGMFKGGLADHSEEVTKLHTATHLLHSALRKILGDSVEQKGSNITAERLRFDFSHPQKLTDEEIEKTEKLINEQIKKDLPATSETKTFKEAKEEGALAFFAGKYGEKVKVYTIGPETSSGRQIWFSKEVCGGPHVSRTSEIGRVRIKKQEKIGAGLVRLYAVVE